MTTVEQRRTRHALGKRIAGSAVFRKFWDIAGAVSVRVKVLGIVLGVVVLLGFFAIVQMNRVLTATLLRDLVEQGAALTDQIASEVEVLLSGPNPNIVHLYLLERRDHFSNESHNTQVKYITLEVAGGLWRAGDDSAGRVAGLTAYTEWDNSHYPEIQASRNYGVVEFGSPLPNNHGTLYLALSLDSLHGTVNRVLLQLAAITLLMLLVGLSAAIFLTWILTRPILDLVHATNAIAQGRLGYRVARWANDEIGELSTAFNSMAAALETAERERVEREQLREQYVSGIILAQENERQRIARELHDSTGQSLTSLLVGLQTLKMAESGQELDGRIDELRTVVANTLDEVRALSWGLRPSVLDDLGLVTALQHLIDDYQARHGIHVDYVVNGMEQRLPAEMETTIYRIVQEGLTNIARYARATHASVVLARRNDALRIIVEDNGVGFRPAQVMSGRSLGLQGIRERTGLFNGKFTIESVIGRGASLFIEIPLAQSDFHTSREGTDQVDSEDTHSTDR